MNSTGSVNGAPRNLMKRPSACPNLWVIMLPLFHMKDIRTIRCSLPRFVSRSRAQFSLKVVSPGWRRSLELCVTPSLCSISLKNNLCILGGMADSGDSATSSPDPLLELEAEVRVLRCRVRRQGNFMQQMDEQGGRRLERIDEDIGRIRSDFTTAFEALEEKVTVAIENLDLRLQSMEINLAKLRDAENSGHGKSQLATKSSSGARHR